MGLPGTRQATHERQRDTFSAVTAILVAVFVLHADLHSTPWPIRVVISSAVVIAVCAIIIGVHSPIATHRPVVPIPTAPHLLSCPPWLILACAIGTVAIALFRSPAATDPHILSALPLLVTRLLGLLRRALRLHGDSLGLVGWLRLSLILREWGI
jgi:hypothetical protein